MLQGVTSYVINLEKRADRLSAFTDKYEKFGPPVELIVIKAIDGTVPDFSQEMYQKETKTELNYISAENDFNNHPRVTACALSHIKVWEEVAKHHDQNAFIFEDDVNFRESALFKRNAKQIYKDIQEVFKEHGPCVIYTGAGDILPIHINIKSEALMRAQEKCHISKVINTTIGVPKTKSAFIFDWLGAFSYCINSETARYLLDELKKTPTTTAIDVYIKKKMEENNKIYMMYPLLAYHDRLETSDSDICPRARIV